MAEYQFFLPAFDPECRRVFHADRQGAQAQLVALDVWNRATGRDLKGRRLVVYRCSRCWGYHVAARYVRDAAKHPIVAAAPTTALQGERPANL